MYAIVYFNFSGSKEEFELDTSGADIVSTDDSAAVDSESVAITVNQVNLPPSLDPIGPRSVNENQNLN